MFLFQFSEVTFLIQRDADYTQCVSSWLYILMSCMEVTKSIPLVYTEDGVIALRYNIAYVVGKGLDCRNNFQDVVLCIEFRDVYLNLQWFLYIQTLQTYLFIH